MRTLPLELWSDHVQLGKRMIGWESVRAVTARAGRVLIEARGEKTPLIVVPTVDGVEEPALAPVFAEIVLDASGGAPPRDKLTRTLSDGKADTKVHGAMDTEGRGRRAGERAAGGLRSF